MWNLTQKWNELSIDCSVTLERLANNRRELHAVSKKFQKQESNDKYQVMFVSDLIVVDAELVASKLTIFRDFYRKFQRVLDVLSAIKKCALVLKPGAVQLRKKITEFDCFIPDLVSMYESELSFKLNSIEEFSFSNDINMFSAIISSWVYGVYIDSAIISCLHALII